MWQDLLNWIHLLWNTGSQTEKNTSSIEELGTSDEQMALAFERLQLQQHHDREMAEQRIAALERELDAMKTMFNQRLNDEAEKIELRLRLEIAQQRQLPPPSN